MFSGGHCEKINEDPTILMIKARFYNTDTPRDYYERDFAIPSDGQYFMHYNCAYACVATLTLSRN